MSKTFTRVILLIIWFDLFCLHTQVNQLTSHFLMTMHLCAESHSLTTLFAHVMFKANALLLVNPHVRVTISLVLVFVGAGIAPVPSFRMALKVSVQVTLVLKSMGTSLALAHVI